MTSLTRKARYRQRLKLQASLARVLHLLSHNAKAGITPDRTTGELAAQLVRWLSQFAREAGVEPATGDEPDLDRYAYLLKTHKKETAKRRARRLKQRARERAADHMDRARSGLAGRCKARGVD